MLFFKFIFRRSFFRWQFLLLFLCVVWRLFSLESYTQNLINQSLANPKQAYVITGIVRATSARNIDLVFGKINSHRVSRNIVLSAKWIDKPLKIGDRLDLIVEGELKYSLGKVRVGSGGEVLEFKVTNSTFFNFIESVRFKIDKIADTFFDENASLFKAMVFGFKEEIDEEVNRIFRNLGLNHILVASGANIILIVQYIKKVLSKFSSLYRRILEFFSVSIYVGLVGFEGSAIRAYVFYIVSVLLGVFGRDIKLFDRFLITFCILCVLLPELLFGMSFLLSSMAVIALGVSGDFMEYFKLNLKKLKPLLETFWVNLIINCYLNLKYKTFNFSSLISNIAVSFLVETIVLAGFNFVILAVFLGLFGLESNVLLQFVSYLINFIIELFLNLNQFIFEHLKYKLFFEVNLQINQVILIYTIIGIMWIYFKYVIWKNRKCIR